MARGRSGLGEIGLILALVGAILLIIFGILEIVATISSGFNQFTQYNYHLFEYSGFNGVVYGIIAIVFGIIIIWAWRYGKIYGHDDELIWGIVFIVFGILAGTIGGLLVLLGGILLLIDFFL